LERAIGTEARPGRAFVDEAACLAEVKRRDRVTLARQAGQQDFACIIPARPQRGARSEGKQALSKLTLGRYTRQGLWSLFLMCALPLHAWTLILAFRDMGWLTERTNAWDAIGVLSYGLLLALIESALVFLAAALLGLLVPRRWEPERRIALLGVFALVLAVWAMLSQLFFLVEARVPEWALDVLVRSPRPLWVIYGTLLVFVGGSLALPAWALLRPGGGLRFVNSIMERLSLLAMLYLVFDAAAIAIVVIRNL